MCSFPRPQVHNVGHEPVAVESLEAECSGTERVNPTWLSGRPYRPDTPILSNHVRKVLRQLFATPAAELLSGGSIPAGQLRSFELRLDVPVNVPPSFKVRSWAVQSRL